jgi:uroporphyrinogen-III synthase
MRVLVTRPQPGADETAARLRAAGHEVLLQPLTRIVFNPQPPSLPRPAAIAFTSRNAVRAVSGWQAAPRWHALPVLAVGEATAAAASDAGFTDVQAAEGDVARLVLRIRAHFVPTGDPILYPAARHRAGDLAAALAEAGIPVATVEAYRAEAVERFEGSVRMRLADRSIDAALFHSRRSATVFVDLVMHAGLVDAVSSLRLLALSQRVAEPLRALSADSVRIAETPDETALLALVRAW